MKYLVFISFLFTLGCGPGQGERTGQYDLTGAIGRDTLKYVYQSFINISKYIIENEGNMDTSYFRISYPEFSDSAINDLIKPSIWIEGEENFEHAAEAFIAGFDEFVEEESTSAIHTPWFKNIQSSVCVNSPVLFSLRTQYQQYTGGAHGNSVVIWSNFDILQNKKIELSDIIVRDKFPELTKRAEKQFRKIEDLTDTASLEKDFFFEHGIFALNDNFGLTKDELVFYYNEYEIKPYSEGITVIRLPYTGIMDILNNQGKAYIEDIQKLNY